MLFQTIHTSGTTIYFVFFILFYWISHIPRTNPGAGWWACAILSAAIARLLLLILSNNGDIQLTIFSYSTFLILEKIFLVIGISRFLKVNLWNHWVFYLAGICSCWMLLAWYTAMPLWIYSIGLAVFNVVVLSFVTVVCFIKRNEVSQRLMLVVSVVCGLLVLHWATFPSIFFFPTWKVIGFGVGTLLVLVQYLGLLASVLLQFQKRLLDAEEKALELAYRDPLTGLNNKHYLSNLFEQALLLATRPHQLLAVIYIDLDNFKPINDSAGHKTGDEVLKEVAKRLKEYTRSTDISARIGGDEFIVIATQLDHIDQINTIANKLLQQLTREIQVDDNTYVLGASIGISFYPAHGDNLASLIEAADEAMYHVKRSGKNGYVVYGENMSLKE